MLNTDVLQIEEAAGVVARAAIRQPRHFADRSLYRRRFGRIGEVERYVITIQGQNFEDVDSAELVAPPEPGETIETSLGQCIVISAESPDERRAVGKIVCRLP